MYPGAPLAAAAQGTPSKDIEHWQHLAQRSAIPGQHNPYNTPIISLDSCHVLKLCWLLISSCLPAFRPQPRTQHLPQHNFSHTAMLHLLNSKAPCTLLARTQCAQCSERSQPPLTCAFTDKVLGPSNGEEQHHRHECSQTWDPRWVQLLVPM